MEWKTSHLTFLFLAVRLSVLTCVLRRFASAWSSPSPEWKCASQHRPWTWRIWSESKVVWTSVHGDVQGRCWYDVVFQRHWFAQGVPSSASTVWSSGGTDGRVSWTLVVGSAWSRSEGLVLSQRSSLLEWEASKDICGKAGCRLDPIWRGKRCQILKVDKWKG